MAVPGLSGFNLAMKHWLSIEQAGFDDDAFIANLVRISSERLRGLGLRCQCRPIGRPEMHPAWRNADGTFAEHCSSYSDGSFFWLERNEWFRLALHVDTSDGKIDFEGKSPMFHGTVWGSAMRICMHSAGFIVGPGTHAVRGKAWSGCWCVPTLGDALSRADPCRYKVNGELSRFSCPVVLEIRAAWLRKVPHSTMHCVPAPVGTSHEGLLITGIHFNTRFMQNYLAFESPQVRGILSSDPSHCRRCACGLCGAYCCPGNADYFEWQASRSRLWYHPRCYTRVTATSCAYF